MGPSAQRVTSAYTVTGQCSAIMACGVPVKTTFVKTVRSLDHFGMHIGGVPYGGWQNAIRVR